ncbi:acetyl esterase/lipase [Williamsia limnetica]|uniref:Acetyl esterase/lipase n=1 Tax=Williamsia limnetica TaxID=882452 RepID=A0A318RER0_WILLI|nr:alpha/beta hydrolase [Williamsia limnetica]PYE12608.1 acetyl esterase/lipase [Williamsia limnetica]
MKAPRLALSIPVSEVLFKPVFRLSLNARLSPSIQRKLLDASAFAIPPIPDQVIRQITLAGRATERITVGPTHHGRAILYLHGGGYTVGSAKSHRGLTTSLARAAEAEVYVLDYRLAPENPCPAAVNDAVAAFRDLMSRGYAPESIAIAGDSAGGGLSIATARILIDEHQITPAALGLISPWVDPAVRQSKDDTGNGATDIVVNGAWSSQAADMYLGDGDPDDPRYAPGRGNLAGLPPTLVQIGQPEMLFDQVTEFAGKLRAAGVETTLSDLGRLWHVGHVAAPLMPAANAAVEELGDFLSAHLRTSEAVLT